jgi:hypothetical protein
MVVVGATWVKPVGGGAIVSLVTYDDGPLVPELFVASTSQQYLYPLARPVAVWDVTGP